MELHVGMIGLSGGGKFYQKAIKFFTKSRFSHSFVVIDASTDVMSALETTETRVCVTPVERKLDEKDYVVIWNVLASAEDKKDAVEYAYLRHSGELYGYLSYFWFIYRWFFRLFGIEKKTMWKWASSGITCGVIIASYIDFLYPEIFIKTDLKTIAPKELNKIMNQHADKFACVGWYKI